MRVLVSGGAGYIGSFVAAELLDEGHAVLVVDDLSTGHRAAVPAGAAFERARVGDTPRLAGLMREQGVEAIVHLAALSLVGESTREPGRYWRENVSSAAGLLEAAVEAGVRRFVLSSTAAVYGEPERVPIPEEHPLAPASPYGATKRAIEEMLGHFRDAAGIGSVSLRYFNAAGADPAGTRGEDHDPETHLVPLAIAAALGRRDALTLFGEDYPTPDGTCVRDYVHVRDLARAHRLALGWLEAHPAETLACNLGEGEGSSVREVLDAVAAAHGAEVPHRVGPRRAGDPSSLVASIERAQRELGWRPEHSSIAEIVRDALAWHRAHPGGYGDRGRGGES